MDRESDPPNLKVENTGNPKVMKATATDANLKGVYYSVDGGEKKLLTSGVETNMGLPDGTHTIIVSADDYFRLVSDTTFQRTITTPVNAPPVINITLPTNGTVYDKDTQLIYTITDTDFDKATYRIDNGTKTTTSQNGTIPLTLADGLHKIVIEATDKKPQTVKDSVSFEMKKAIVNAPPVITFIAPENGKLYDKDISLQYNITDTDFDKATYRIDNGTKISASQSGTVPLTLADGLHKIVIEAIDKKPQAVKDSVSFEMKKTTAIEQPPISEDKVTLYPMPAGDFVNIKTLSSTSKLISRTLYDVTGRQVYNDEIEVNIGEDVNRLDISKLASGLYFLRTVEQGSIIKPRTYNIVKF